MRVSVIIPIWLLSEELFNLTAKTLETLSATQIPEGDETEFILIDNGSPDYSIPLLELNPKVYLRNKVNLGYPKAVNQGFKLATGDYICVANNDIKVSDNWWVVAKEIFERVPDAGLVHFRMLGYDEPNIPGDQIYPDGKERWCHGSFYVIKREVVEKVGMYDEAFTPGGYDDYDFFGRIRKAGYKQVYTNGAFFQHKDSSTLSLGDQTKRSEVDIRNREYYKKKHGEYPDIEFAKQFPKQMEEQWKPFP